jgi:hypothetical protein
MRRTNLGALIVIGAVAFFCGIFLSQPSQGQQKDQKPAPVMTGRYQLTAMPGVGAPVVLTDTATGQTWYKFQLGDKWKDTGFPK